MGGVKTDLNPEFDGFVPEAVVDRTIQNAYEVPIDAGARGLETAQEGRGYDVWAYPWRRGYIDTLALERVCCDKLECEFTEWFYKGTQKEIGDSTSEFECWRKSWQQTGSRPLKKINLGTSYWFG